MGVGGQRHAPAALLPGKTRYPLHRRLGGPLRPVWTGAKNLAPAGILSPDRPAIPTELSRPTFEPRQRYEIFLLSKPVQTGSEAHTAFYSTGSTVLSEGGRKRQGLEIGHSFPSRDGFKNEWNYNSAPPLHHHDVDGDNFTCKA